METLKLILYCTVVFGMMLSLILSFAFGLFWLIKFIVQKNKKVLWIVWTTQRAIEKRK